MKCPRCKAPMKRLWKVECRTGDADKYKCDCGALAYQDTQLREWREPEPLQKTLRGIAAQASL